MCSLLLTLLLHYYIQCIRKVFRPLDFFYILLRLVVACQAAAIPSGDAASYDALNGAAVEHFKDLRAHDKSFQPPDGEEALSCIHDCVGVCGS